MILKTTFGQSQRWSRVPRKREVENERKSDLDLANEVLYKGMVLNFGSPSSRTFLYIVSSDILTDIGSVVFFFIDHRVCSAPTELLLIQRTLVIKTAFVPPRFCR